MAKSLTYNNLILLLTENIPAKQRLDIHSEMKNDWLMAEQYAELKTAYTALVKVVKKPSPDSLQNIMRYSRQSVDPVSA